MGINNRQRRAAKQRRRRQASRGRGPWSGDPWDDDDAPWLEDSRWVGGGREDERERLTRGPLRGRTP